MRRALLMMTLPLASCDSSQAPAVSVVGAQEVGVVGQSSLIVGRDGGWGSRLFGHQVFIFGDTFVTQPDVDGSGFHSNSFSFTEDQSAADGIGGLEDRLDAVGSPMPLIPPTEDEAAFNAAHRGDPCAEEPCGARWALWAGAGVFDARRGRALVSYGLLQTGDGDWIGGGQSIAVWNDWNQQAERPVLDNCPGHPTALFCDGEAWATSLLIDGDDLYDFACTNGGFSSSCKLARVPLADVMDRSKWQGWNGSSFGPLAEATVLFEGGLNMRVHYNRHAGAWMAIYSLPFSNEVTYRTAPELTGPWSDAAVLFVADNPSGSTYDAYVQPDYSENDGQILYVTFSRSISLFGSELALERITLAR